LVKSNNLAPENIAFSETQREAKVKLKRTLYFTAKEDGGEGA
jgi:hypothetical protein